MEPAGYTSPYRLAGNFRRLCAGLIHFVFIACLTYFLTAIFLLPLGEWSIGLALHVNAAMAVISYPIWGGNFGHMVMGIKVVSTHNGDDFKDPLKGLLREMLKPVVLPITWLLSKKQDELSYSSIFRSIVVKK